MQNVLYGAVPPPQKNAYHQRSVSSAPLAEQFCSASRKSHVHQREAAGAVSGESSLRWKGDFQWLGLSVFRSVPRAASSGVF